MRLFILKRIVSDADFLDAITSLLDDISWGSDISLVARSRRESLFLAAPAGLLNNTTYSTGMRQPAPNSSPSTLDYG